MTSPKGEATPDKGGLGFRLSPEGQVEPDEKLLQAQQSNFSSSMSSLPIASDVLDASVLHRVDRNTDMDDDEREKIACARDDLAVFVEEALGREVLALWQRVDEGSSDGVIAIGDIADRIAAHVASQTTPTSDLASAARLFARASRTFEAAVATRNEPDAAYAEAVRAWDDTTRRLQDFAVRLEYGCRLCGSQLVRLDDGRRCRDCAAPVRDLEAEFDEECRVALAAYRDNFAMFSEATRGISEKHPGLTMLEFFERAGRRPPPRFTMRPTTEVKKCRAYDTACINSSYCDARDACCAGDPACRAEVT